MMKGLRTMACLAAIATLGTTALAQSVRVQVNGQEVNFPYGQPRSINGRVMVPLRGVFEALGATVEWDPSTRTVNAQRGDRRVRLSIGQNDASINGTPYRLDVPATVIEGTTYVPVRFIGEALGAAVDYQANTRTVRVTTGEAVPPVERRPDETLRDNQPGLTEAERERRRIERQNQRREREREQTRAERLNDNVDFERIPRYTVIPVRLNTNLSSERNRKGDPFQAVVRPDEETYLGIPDGAIVEGVVADVRPQRGNEPGLMELDFRFLRLPNGRRFPIDGTLISLDEESVDRENGRIVAKGKARDNKGVYAGYGAGAGAIIGLLQGNRTLENALLGGLIGLAVGALERPRENPSNVNLTVGTRFGVRLDEDLVTRGRGTTRSNRSEDDGVR